MDEPLRAALLSAVLVLVAGPWAVARLRRFRQRIREDAPARHQGKEGTPTMGGVLLVGAAVLAALAAGPKTWPAGVVLGATLGFGGIGALDDYLAVTRGRNLGLRARERLALQVPLALALGAYAASRVGSIVAVPGTGLTLDLGRLYPVFALLYIVGFVNAVNLTDGLDGLAAGTVAVAAGAYALLAARGGRPDVAAVAAAVAGACAGFLWFNAHPAQVFMGDVGSNALGAALAALAMVTKTELLMVVVGAVFAAEALSVLLQVAYFQTTGGKRIFRMSPLHHHFELAGWAETQVVVRFWLVGLAAAAVGLVLAGRV
ncbi:MAG: phospho-N-acetylmuramoyl-pentapeptide-transferase [Armatimonadetes bacterium]|nr:phospho-N-acetylmuramoyl-pentapeptide-transferase [Armatimonadota bacterium]